MGALLNLSPQYAAVLGLATLRIAAPRAPNDERVRLLWLRAGTVEAVAS